MQKYETSRFQKHHHILIYLILFARSSVFRRWVVCLFQENTVCQKTHTCLCWNLLVTWKWQSYEDAEPESSLDTLNGAVLRSTIRSLSRSFDIVFAADNRNYFCSSQRRLPARSFDDKSNGVPFLLKVYEIPFVCSFLRRVWYEAHCSLFGPEILKLREFWLETRLFEWYFICLSLQQL